MRSRAADAAAKRLRPAFTVAFVLLVLLLGFFAWALANSQSQQRSDINKRFSDRAKVAATVNESIFTLAYNSIVGADADRFAGAKVNQAALAQRTALQKNLYA